MLDTADFEKMKSLDISAADRAALADIRDVAVNTSLPPKERALDFIRQIGNPYCYKHGKYVVKVGFADTQVSLTQHPELHEYAVRIDDGWSGSTFQRPSFQKMIEDVKAGRTNCIVVKDMSRFGREYLQVGYYTENYFPTTTSALSPSTIMWTALTGQRIWTILSPSRIS